MLAVSIEVITIVVTYEWNETSNYLSFDFKVLTNLHHEYIHLCISPIVAILGMAVGLLSLYHEKISGLADRLAISERKQEESSQALKSKEEHLRHLESLVQVFQKIKNKK